MMQIVQESDVPEEVEEYCYNIDTASYQLLSLIDNVLDVSDMEYGILKLSKSVFDFNNMIRDIMQVISYNTSEKQQALDINIDPAIPALLKGDEKRFKQVITNLLANAVKFTPEHGEIYFRACFLNEDAGIITLQIEVADNGIGISKEQHISLFNIFEQVDGSMSRKHCGIGVGLPLSKHIVEMMGGTIWVESELGKGAKFIFTCKLEKNQA
jgi:signal transduction histidine kinase